MSQIKVFYKNITLSLQIIIIYITFDVRIICQSSNYDAI